MKTAQEYDNLIAQLIGLLELYNHSGSAASMSSWSGRGPSPSPDQRLQVVLGLTKPSQHVQLPDLNDTDSVAEFLENRLDIRIKPQPTEHYPTHPLWILWHSFGAYDHDHCTALWLYREVLMHYMDIGDFKKAAQVLRYASDIKVSTEPLPLLHPYVIRKVMKLKAL